MICGLAPAVGLRSMKDRFEAMAACAKNQPDCCRAVREELGSAERGGVFAIDGIPLAEDDKPRMYRNCAGRHGRRQRGDTSHSRAGGAYLQSDGRGRLAMSQGWSG